MRTGEHVHLAAARLERRSEERDRRPFPVGAGDVEDRRQPVLWTAEALEQRRDALEPQPVAGRRQCRETVELRLDERVRRAREIRHQAASFVSGARYEISFASTSLSSPRETTMSIIPCSSRYSAR